MTTNPDETLRAVLEFALSFCRSGEMMSEWHTKNRRAIDLLPNDEKEKLRVAFRAKRLELEKDNGRFG